MGNHPLVLVGLVITIITVLLSDAAITDLQRPYFQKQSIGEAIKISNNSKFEIDKLLKTPYLQVINSGIGAIYKTLLTVVNAIAPVFASVFLVLRKRLK